MQLETVTHCPICGNENFKDYLSAKDYTTSGEVFKIQSCESCNLLITNPRPTADTISSYYQSADYISHTNKAANLFDRLYLIARNYTLSWKHKIISKRRPQGIILDFGCGTGEFLAKMREKSWTTFGIEPSPQARQQAASLEPKKDNTIAESLSALNKSGFDVITLWHVLEHIHQPNELLAQLKSRLKKDGLIIVAVPNYQSHDATVYTNHWAAYDVPRHLWHFSKKAMTNLLIKNGFVLNEILPMKLDAYYVSLLSEKYKSNNTKHPAHLLKAILNAQISNRKAKRSTNYSSLIYIARHA